MTTARDLARGAPEVVAAVRMLYQEFPELRRLLMDSDKRTRVVDILTRTLVDARTASVSDAVATVMAAGYHVTSGPVETKPLRPRAPGTAYAPGSDTIMGTVTAESQRGRLLLAYAADNGVRGLTDEEAHKAANIPDRSCWWKRCGELRQHGLIEPMVSADGSQVFRTGDAGAIRGVCVVTPEGLAVAAALE